MPDFDRLLPPLATLVTFEAAERHGNFTRAAEELFVSQATVSRHVRDLERDLGVHLFERHRHDVMPTAAGTSFATSVRLSLGELASAADRLRRTADEERTLTVLSSLSLASTVVAPALVELQRARPELRIRLLSGCDPVDQTPDNFDLAVQYWGPHTAGFEIEYLAAEAVFPVCAPSYAETIPPSVTPAMLTDLDLIQTEHDDPSTVSWPAFLARLGVDCDSASMGDGSTFGSYSVCLDLAEQGHGIALGWDRSVRPRLERGSLVRLPGSSADEAGAVRAFIPTHRARNRFVDDCLDLLRSAFADDQGTMSRSTAS
ncbi:MAG: LysR substrate-binding domain-containing protein [Actinomycetota bacterium]